MMLVTVARWGCRQCWWWREPLMLFYGAPCCQCRTRGALTTPSCLLLVFLSVSDLIQSFLCSWLFLVSLCLFGFLLYDNINPLVLWFFRLLLCSLTCYTCFYDFKKMCYGVINKMIIEIEKWISFCVCKHIKLQHSFVLIEVTHSCFWPQYLLTR